MGIKNRILRREPGPETPVPDDATTEFATQAADPATAIVPAAGATAEHAVPAGAEHAPQGDALMAAPAPAVHEQDPAPATAEHEPQGDALTAGGPVADAAPGDAAAAPAPVPDAAVLAASATVPAAAARRPGFRERGQLRRRLRFLREARELGYRDLGGLVVDQHRFQRPNEALVQGKVAAIDAVDRELRAIEDVLAARRPYDELFVPGVSACVRCGALHGSDARFCPHCGLDFRGPHAVAGVWTEGAQQQATEATPPSQSALFDPHAAPADAPAPPA